MTGDGTAVPRSLVILISVFIIGSATASGVAIADGPSTIQASPPSEIPSSRTAATAANEYCGLTGNLETATRPGKTGAVRVDKPSSLTDLEPPNETAQEFAEVTRLVNVSDSSQRTVVGVVPPSEIEKTATGWGERGGNGICLEGTEGALWGGLMTHEYIHTRQEFSVGSDMEWIIEASAFYYMTVVTYRRGTLSKERANRSLSDPDRDTSGLSREMFVLTKSTEYNESVTYSVARGRGKAVLAALDHEIRDETDGRRTLEHVFQEMSDEDRVISYPTFKDIVARVVGDRMDGWLDTYVLGVKAISSNRTTVDGLTLTASAAESDVRIREVRYGSSSISGEYPDSIHVNHTRGTEAQISVIAVNEGTVRSQQNLTLTTTGPERERIARTNGTIPPGEPTRLSLPTDSLRALDAGEHRITLATRDDVVNGTLSVNADKTTPDPTPTEQRTRSSPDEQWTRKSPDHEREEERQTSFRVSTDPDDYLPIGIVVFSLYVIRRLIPRP